MLCPICVFSFSRPGGGPNSNPTHTHTRTNTYFETLICCQGLSSLFSSQWVGVCVIESSESCARVLCEQLFGKAKVWQNVVWVALLCPCQSAAQVDQTKLCFYLFILGLCQGWKKAKETLSSLFSMWSRLSWSNSSSSVSSQWPWRLCFWGYAALCENLRILWHLINWCHRQMERGFEQKK